MMLRRSKLHHNTRVTTTDISDTVYEILTVDTAYLLKSKLAYVARPTADLHFSNESYLPPKTVSTVEEINNGHLRVANGSSVIAMCYESTHDWR